MWEWLLSPIDAGRPHQIGTLLSWHARAMVLGWGICVPLGVLIARYFKIWPGQDWPRELDSQRWWIAHRVFQYTAAALSLIAVLLIWLHGRDHADAQPHRILGYGVLALLCLQVAGGLLRGTKGGPTDRAPDGSLRGDHFDMSRRRLAFEVVHKGAGYLALVLAVAAILSGLWYANGPVWMWGVLGLWWAALGWGAVLCQRRRMAVDTYQAIWGPDTAYPGNRLRPVGVGVTRPDPGAGARGRAGGSDS